VASGEETKSSGKRERRAGMMPGLYKGEEGFLASLEMTGGASDEQRKSCSSFTVSHPKAPRIVI
jgi:hypothetical protein